MHLRVRIGPTYATVIDQLSARFGAEQLWAVHTWEGQGHPPEGGWYDAGFAWGLESAADEGQVIARIREVLSSGGPSLQWTVCEVAYDSDGRESEVRQLASHP